MQRLSICIAEDSNVVRAAIQSLLTKSGYFDVVGAVPDGRAALNSCREPHPQLVLLDVSMPEMDGIEAARQISALSPDSVIIMLSSQDDMEVIRDALKAGARDFIRKPIHGPDLIQKILTIYAREGSRRSSTSESLRRKILAFTSSKTGAGTTTIAINSAVALARKLRKKVLVMDLDVLYADASHCLGRKQQPSMAELLLSPDPQRLENIRKFIMETTSGVYLLPGPSTPTPDLIRYSGIEAVIRSVEADYDFVIIDFPHMIDDFWVRILEATDQIFLVVGSDVPSIRSTKVYLENLKKTKIPTRRVKIVYNHVTTDGNVDRKDVQDFINMPVYSEISCDRESVTKAYLSRTPFLLKELTQISRDVETLVEKVFLGRDSI